MTDPIFWYNVVQSNRMPDVTDPYCGPMWYGLTGSWYSFWSDQTGYRIPRNPTDWIENWTNPDKNWTKPDKNRTKPDRFQKGREYHSAFDAYLGES